MAKVLNLKIFDKEYRFKDKKEAFKLLDQKPSFVDELNHNFIQNQNFKHIKDIYQYVFNYFSSNKDNIDYSGKCIICGKDTSFNILTKKYTRLNSEECIEKYKQQFKERMNKVHGRDYFTQDASALKTMLNNRSLTKIYKIGNFSYNVTGQYEEDFLDFMFYILKCRPEDLIECPFNIPYTFNGVERIYMPDFYMPSLNLVIEIKSTKSAYAERDLEFEEAKKRAGFDYMKKQNGYYFYLNDKRYADFLKFLESIL